MTTRQNSGKIQMCNTSCRLEIITVLTAVVPFICFVVFVVLDLPIIVRVHVCVCVDVFREALNENRI